MTGTRSKNAARLAVGPELAALLPPNPLPWYRTPHLLQLNLILIIPWLSAAAYGYDGSIMKGLQSLPQWRKYFHKPTAPILGTINAIYPIGKFFGLFATSWMSDRYGRKAPMYLGFALLVIGAIMGAASHNVALFIVARLVLGAGTAFVAQPAPVLISELAYPTHRGRMTSLYYSTYYIGAIIAAWGTYGTFKMQSNWSWRLPVLIQGVLPLGQLLLLFIVPESPRWLIAKGKKDQAHALLTKYHAGGDPNSRLVAFEVKEIEASIAVERSINSETSYQDLIKTKANRKRTFIAMIVGFYGTWSGVAIIAYYLTLVLNTIGITNGSDQTLINGCTQIFNLLVSINAALFIDRIGRRKLWLVGAAGMLMSFIGWTILSARFAETKDVAVGRSVLAFIFLYKLFYDGAYSPMLLAYPIEIFPYTLRSRGLSVSMATNQVALIAAQFINPIALDKIGWRYYIVFCVLLVGLFILAYLFFPETKEKTLEEIAEIFDEPHISHGGEDIIKVDDEGVSHIELKTAEATIAAR